MLLVLGDAGPWSHCQAHGDCSRTHYRPCNAAKKRLSCAATVAESAERKPMMRTPLDSKRL